MKKLIVNMSETTYEKLRLECIKQKKEMSEVITERILFKKFDSEVEEAFSKFWDKSFMKLVGENEC